MTVRAKFKVASVMRSQYLRQNPETKVYEPVEIQTLKLSPVSGNGDPNHENTKFWNASPSGDITLGTINKAAGDYFELGGEYYVDFVKAPAA